MGKSAGNKVSEREHCHTKVTKTAEQGKRQYRCFTAAFGFPIQHVFSTSMKVFTMDFALVLHSKEYGYVFVMEWHHGHD